MCQKKGPEIVYIFVLGHFYARKDLPEWQAFERKVFYNPHLWIKNTDSC